MLYSAAFSNRKGLQCTHLVQDKTIDLLRRYIHHATAEAMSIWQTWMRADGNIVFKSKLHCFTHRQWIACMKATSNICRCYIFHQLFILSKGINAKAFTHITI